MTTATKSSAPKPPRKSAPRPKGLAVKAGALRKMARELANIALHLEGGQADAVNVDPAVTNAIIENFRDPAVASKVLKAYCAVSAEYHRRSIRTRHLPADLFGEPAWDMLLFLYMQRVKSAKVKVTMLCAAAGVPPTTALRYIDALQGHALIEKSASSTDTRVVFVSLTDTAFENLTDFLGQ